jgi:hypothetical protein
MVPMSIGMGSYTNDHAMAGHRRSARRHSRHRRNQERETCWSSGHQAHLVPRHQRNSTHDGHPPERSLLAR